MVAPINASGKRMKQPTSVLAQGLKLVGTITGDGLVEVRGEIEGELNCTSVVVGETAKVSGNITAQEVVVDGFVEGPILGGNVTLKSRAHLAGDIQYQSMTVEKGAFFEGRLTRGASAPTTIPRVEAAFLDRHRVRAEKGEHQTEALLDGKEVLVASVLCFALISMLTWVIAG
jgi:cytoskeletal protein CcmA (bactofilin family)